MYKQLTRLEHTEDLADYWSDHWDSQKIEEFVAACAESDLAAIFRKHLPRGRSLEAGCGLGPWVVYLRRIGYDVEGVECVASAVEAAHRFDPDLPVRTGDVCALDRPDEYYHGYISLGVIEHYEDGPEHLLAEARRVTKGPREGGRLLISVPLHTRATDVAAHRREALEGVLNPDAPLGDQAAGGTHFFQYLFTHKEFVVLLERNGLRVLALEHYDLYSTLALLWPRLFHRATQHGGPLTLAAKGVAKAMLLAAPRGQFAHIQLAICEKA
jgi:SAM-dependent methyltransferase